MTSSERYERLSESDRTWHGPFGARPGVERLDDEIAADLVQTLADDPALQTSEIAVAVDHGIVTLSGQADTPGAKRTAADDAWDVPGVVDVRNDLLLPEDTEEA